MWRAGLAIHNKLRSTHERLPHSPGDDIDGLSLEDISERPLAPQEVRVKVHAVSLNYRDLMVCKGSYLVNAAYPIIL